MRKVYWWTKQSEQLDLDILEIIKLFLNEYGGSALINNEGFLQRTIEKIYSFILENQGNRNIVYLLQTYCNARLHSDEMRAIYTSDVKKFKRKYNIDYE